MTTAVFFSSLLLGLIILTAMSASLFGISREVPELRVAASDCSEANNYCAPTKTPELTEAINRQQERGLLCTTEPVLTDVILFQWSKDLAVDALTFDQARDASGLKRGWVQRYCA